MSWTEILYIFVVLFKIFYFIVRRAPGRKCTIKINARQAGGFGRLAILESLYGRSAPVLLATGRAVITPIQSMFVRVGCIANVKYRNWSIILECDI